MKAAASSFVICSLLVNHTSYASSRQAPLFRMKKASRARVTATDTDTASATRERYTVSEDYVAPHTFVRKAKEQAGLKNKRRNQEIAIDGGRGMHKDSHNQEFVTPSSHGSETKGPLSSQINQNYTPSTRAASAAATAATSTRERKASKIKASATSIESKTSRLIQIPLALTLQHAADTHDEVPIATLLDTGAQVTVMTYDAAKRAGIAHLIDTRYAGHASGVAGVSCRVLGRIPANSVSFHLGGDDVVDASPAITVLEDRIMDGEAVDMLLGLDVLEEWQAMVCLRDRTLTIRNGCRRLVDRELVIPFVGSAKSKPSSKSTRNQDRYTPASSSSSNQERYMSTSPSSSHSYGSRSNTSSSTPSSRYSSSGKGHRSNPFARDSSLLESELDALDQRSKTSSEGTRMTNVSAYTSTHLNCFEEADDYEMDDDDDDDSDSNYFESEDDYDGCDLSGL